MSKSLSKSVVKPASKAKSKASESNTLDASNSSNSSNSSFTCFIPPFKLKPHQHRNIYRMYKLESEDLTHVSPEDQMYVDADTNISYQITSFQSNAGILADPPGSGKSHTILGLIGTYKELIPKKMEFTACNLFQSGYINSTIIPTKKQLPLKINTNILIVPQALVKQWVEYTKFTNLKVMKLATISDAKEPIFEHPELLEEYHLVIISINFYKNHIDTMAILFSNIIVNRLIIDEPLTMSFPKFREESMPRALFYWLVTASYTDLVPYLHGQINVIKKILKNIPFEYEPVQKTLMILNNSDDILEAFGLEKPIYKKYLIKNTKAINIVKGLVSTDVLNALFADDIQASIELMNIGKGTTDNVIDMAIQHLNLELNNENVRFNFINSYKWSSEHAKQSALDENANKIKATKLKIQTIKTRILEKDKCVICDDDTTNEVITACLHKFCFECLTVWLYKQSKCPTCIHPMSLDDLIFLDDTCKPSQHANTNSNIYKAYTSKTEIVDTILLNNSGEVCKYLIFSNYDATFDHTIALLKSKDIKFRTIGVYTPDMPSNGRIHTHITEMRASKDTEVLFLNSKHFGAGLNIEFASDAIIMHKVPENLKMQIVGRLQRVGRTQTSRVHELLYESEL